LNKKRLRIKKSLLVGGPLEWGLGSDLTKTRKYQIKSDIFHLVSGWPTSRASTKN
jgi:hypothetical protein